MHSNLDPAGTPAHLESSANIGAQRHHAGSETTPSHPTSQDDSPSREPRPTPTSSSSTKLARQHQPGQPVLADAAFMGLAGKIVTTIAPHTEAHPAALLLQFLACFGNAVGRGPHCMVGATRHGLNLYVVLVGDSSKARKGTSWSQIARIFSQVDPHWLATRVTSARLTPHGLVHALRDQDPPTDRRLLVLCEEFAGLLQALKRTAGQLSPMIRSAWDNGDLPTHNLVKPMAATSTHISMIAHITQGELSRHFPSTEARNGFANRCLWTWVQRGSCLPDGGNVEPEQEAILIRRLRNVQAWATGRNETLFQRDAAAAQLWNEQYPRLSQMQPGLRGAATSRAEAQVLRLSAIYAALDQTSTIGTDHLEAALAVWQYCADSAALCFGLSVGNPIADRIREAIESSNGGLNRKKISALFHGHVERERIEEALAELTSLGVLHCDQVATTGRPANLWSGNHTAAAARENEAT